MDTAEMTGDRLLRVLATLANPQPVRVGQRGQHPQQPVTGHLSGVH